VKEGAKRWRGTLGTWPNHGGVCKVLTRGGLRQIRVVGLNLVIHKKKQGLTEGEKLEAWLWGGGGISPKVCKGRGLITGKIWDEKGERLAAVREATIFRSLGGKGVYPL